jgi:hypothetical protein
VNHSKGIFGLFISSLRNLLDIANTSINESPMTNVLLCLLQIVDSILSYLDISDLKSCRLVNSQYNEIACYNLARKEVIIFNKMAHLSSYLRIMPISSFPRPTKGKDSNAAFSENGILMMDYHSKMDNNSNAAFSGSTTADEESHFFTNYAHTSYHFNFDPECDQNESQDGNTAEALEEFYSTIGPHIKSLSFTTDLIPFNFPKRLPHIGDIWANRLENLETLSFEMKWGIPPVLFEKKGHIVQLPSVKRLNLDILVTEREADRAAVFIRQLLAATPNLEEISIPGNKKYFDDYINVVLGRIILSMDLPKLTTLDFCLALNEPQIRGLTEKNFPLKSLILDFADVQQLSFPAMAPLPLQPPNEHHHDDENNNNHNNHHHNNPQLNHFFLQSQLLNRSLHNFFLQVAPTLRNLHLCFPYSPSHPLHRFTFPVPMARLQHLALGGFYGSVSILENLPAIRKLDLWNVRFHDFDYGSDNKEGSSCSAEGGSEQAKQFVPNQYLSITTVIS